MRPSEQVRKLAGQLGDDLQFRIIEHQRHADQPQVRQLPVVQATELGDEGLDRIQGGDGFG